MHIYEENDSGKQMRYHSDVVTLSLECFLDAFNNAKTWYKNVECLC